MLKARGVVVPARLIGLALALALVASCGRAFAEPCPPMGGAPDGKLYLYLYSRVAEVDRDKVAAAAKVAVAVTKAPVEVTFGRGERGLAALVTVRSNYVGDTLVWTLMTAIEFPGEAPSWSTPRALSPSQDALYDLVRASLEAALCRHGGKSQGAPQ